ncbi:hypothetical protein HJG60_009982 [Phyllostomus discolor]|uniref:Uncharacterized protein n=1 Tax=Phyllostomus discolor TaxID=89673 RepID=A0A834EQK0_9CHIR|nr:hypothetical protein HJG60_009982 [Phyllostomus discolor]
MQKSLPAPPMLWMLSHILRGQPSQVCSSSSSSSTTAHCGNWPTLLSPESKAWLMPTGTGCAHADPQGGSSSLASAPRVLTGSEEAREPMVHAGLRPLGHRQPCLWAGAPAQDAMARAEKRLTGADTGN